MPLADELAALRQAGRVKSTSSRLSAEVDKHGATITSPEEEAKRRKEKAERQRQSLLDAQNALHSGGKGAGLGDLNLLYKKLISQQREKKREAEKNLHEWRKQHSGKVKDGEGEEAPSMPDAVANEQALEMLPEHVVEALKQKYETEDGAEALKKALVEESEHGRGALAELMELPASPVKAPFDEKKADSVIGTPVGTPEKSPEEKKELDEEEVKEEPKEEEVKGEEPKPKEQPKDTTPNELRIEHTKRFYNTHTQQFVDNVSSRPALTPTARREAFVAHVQHQQHLDESDPITVIDLGCGYGRDALHFSSAGHRVLGVDFAIQMLARASRMAPKAHYINRDVRTLKEVLVDESVDGIWAHACLGHLPKEDARGVLAGLRAKVRPAGVLYLSLRLGSEERRGTEGEVFGIDERYPASEEEVPVEEDSRRKLYSYYTEEEVKELLVESGWEVMEVAEDDCRQECADYVTHSMVYAFAMRREEQE